MIGGAHAQNLPPQFHFRYEVGNVQIVTCADDDRVPRALTAPQSHLRMTTIR